MKQKILLCINCLKDIGGISTSAINLINEIHDLYDLTILITSDYISPNYNIPSDVKIIRGSRYLRDVIIDRKYLSHQNIFQQIIRNARRVLNHYLLKQKGIEYALKRIKIEDEFDVAIAFTDYRYSNSECKCFDYEVVQNNVKASRKIAWIHNDPVKLGWTNELALKRLTKFDAIVNVSYYCKNIFDKIAPELKNKSYVVYNTYDIQGIKHKSISSEKLFSDNGKIHFVTVARIQIEQKRIDRIIDTCERLKNECVSNFDWTLVGTSPQVKELRDKVHSLGLDDYIQFVGLQPNPYPYMKQADAFVLTSEYEGLGMTIKESQILETPTFVTGFGAAVEAVEDGKQGIICDNSTEGVYRMINYLVQNPNIINKYRDYLRDNGVDNHIALNQFDNICRINK